MRSLLKFILITWLIAVSGTAMARTVTVSASDIPFDVAKQILLNYDRSLTGLGDEALKTVLSNRRTLSFDDSMLPADLRSRLSAQQKIGEVTEQLRAGKEWAEMGQAIGIATRGALSAVTDETARFAETTPGRFTMLMVAWKVMGPDFIRTVKGVLIGAPLLAVWIALFVWWLRKVYGWRKRKIVDAEGKKTYEQVEPLSVQWSKEWNQTCVEIAKALAPKDKQTIEYPASWYGILAGFQFVAFVIVMFWIVWFIIL